MTVIISAFPCLGKTTLTNRNKEKYFDFEVYESRATKGLTKEGEQTFFKNCAENIKLVYQSGIYEVVFVTDDERLLDELRALGLSVLHILPNIYSDEDMIDYVGRVTNRSRLGWYQKVLEDDVMALPKKVEKLKQLGETVLFAKSGEYIEHVAPSLFSDTTLGFVETSDTHWR